MNQVSNPQHHPDAGDSCESFEIAISEMLDGELTGSDKTRLGQHLIQCASCRQTVREFEALNHSLMSLGEPQETPLVRRKIKSSWISAYRVIPAAIATALAVCLLFMVWPLLQPNQVNAEELVERMQTAEQVTAQQQLDQELSLRVMEMQLRMLRVELEELQESNESEALEVAIDSLMHRVLEEQVAMACSE